MLSPAGPVPSPGPTIKPRTPGPSLCCPVEPPDHCPCPSLLLPCSAAAPGSLSPPRPSGLCCVGCAHSPSGNRMPQGQCPPPRPEPPGGSARLPWEPRPRHCPCGTADLTPSSLHLGQMQGKGQFPGTGCGRGGAGHRWGWEWLHVSPLLSWRPPTSSPASLPPSCPGLPSTEPMSSEAAGLSPPDLAGPGCWLRGRTRLGV